MKDIVIVGGGVMGITIAKAMQEIQGRDVEVIDDARPLSGSIPSGGCLKPSKLAGIPEGQETQIYDMLDRLFHFHVEKFIIRPSGNLLNVNVYLFDTSIIFDYPKTFGKVVSLFTYKGCPGVEYLDRAGDRKRSVAKVVIVAASMGSLELFPKLAGILTAKIGVSFRFRGIVKQNFVQVWAPYKQITVHKFHDKEGDWIWGSDGSVLKPENWTDERTIECRDRIMAAAKLKNLPVKTLMGLRPYYANAKPCFVGEMNDKIWLATGSGKFGAASSGWAASELMKRTH